MIARVYTRARVVHRVRARSPTTDVACGLALLGTLFNG